MRITHLGHSCLLVETADARILVDPGGFSPGARDQRALDAVLVTHQHADHLDRDIVPDLLRGSPDVVLLADPDSAGLLHDLGFDAQSLGAGEEVSVKGATVTGVGELHALIHDDLPRIHNTGMRISAAGEPTLFHPGDALDAEPEGVDVLAFPLHAPWARSREMTAFLRRLAAPTAVPVHDGLLNGAGRKLYLTQARDLGSPITAIRDLGDGLPADFAL
ncbi:MBL fold metallo-hydrolase [Pedococcus sp. 5OH_020]|uniref:MBL fold metallo-hydrolase n=1 Tax=Pedococcus sp. 5OH_020 TaxID=2989814 RepID=UPI0022E9B5F2|nr:MBL fold metallo-hydrolase [Pedococcus sp. 5OH_020]